MIFRTSTDEIRRNAAEAISSSTNITDLSPGSRARSFVDAFAAEIGRAQASFEFTHQMAYLQNAKGYFLDLIGQSIGLPRIEALPGIVSAADRLLKFYVESGTLAQYLVANTIPEGTLVSDDTGTVSYRISSDVMVDDVQRQVHVPAISTATGNDQRVGIGVLTSHNLGIPQVLVTNDDVIDNASDIETDENYRFRLANAQHLKSTSTRSAVQTATSSIQGVSDVVLKDFSHGVGSYSILVVPTKNRIDQSTIAAVAVMAFLNSAFGTKVEVVPPEEAFVELVARLTYAPGTLSLDRESIRAKAEDAIVDYLNAIGMGGTINPMRMMNAAMNADARVEDVAITCFNVRREPHTIAPVVLDEDEIVVPDPEVERPILVT